MRAFVFTDKSLERRAGQFVWLAINTEKSGNAAVLAKFPVSAWPSFFIVDPRSEKVRYRWTGGATVAQLDGWLDEARKPGRPGAYRAALASADRANGAADYTAAARLYARALSAAPRGAGDVPRAMDAYLFALQMTRQYAPCAQEALRAYPRERGLANAANVAGSGLDCALSLPRETPGRAGLVSGLEAACRDVLANTKVRFATDDLSGVYEELVAARAEAGDAAGKAAYEKAWVGLLESAASRAKTPAQRTVFDSHRLEAYLEIGHPERAIPMLEESQKDFPEDYNPPARLAIAYGAMKDYPHALEAADRALSLAYGPRKLTIYRTKASLLASRGDREGAIRTLREALGFAASLPKAQVYGVAALKSDLARLEAAASPRGASGAPGA